jgi:hypothetical protein
MSLVKGRSLFAERVDLMLIEELQGLSGINKLRDPGRAQNLQVFYGDYKDVSQQTKRELASIKAFDAQIVPIFWKEFGDVVKLLPVKSRLAYGLPAAVDKACESFYDLGLQVKKRSTITELIRAPFNIEGTQRGTFDDIAIFDLPYDMIRDGVIDLSSVAQFLTAGSTVSFFLPAQQHASWYMSAKKHAIPLQIHCDKQLSPIFNKQITGDVHSIIFGVGQPNRSEGAPTSSTNSTATVGLGAETSAPTSTAASLGLPTTSEGRPIIGSKSAET